MSDKELKLDELNEISGGTGGGKAFELKWADVCRSAVSVGLYELYADTNKIVYVYKQAAGGLAEFQFKGKCIEAGKSLGNTYVVVENSVSTGQTIRVGDGMYQITDSVMK